MYLFQILQKYTARNLTDYSYQISQLGNVLRQWASGCYIAINESGSRAKGTAISIASDVDYMVSLTNNCNENNGGLKSIYNSLHSELSRVYPGARKQNVSIRIDLPGRSGNLEVDVTPARKWQSDSNDHSLWVSKQDTWKKTNINVHLNDVSKSGRLNEIKLLKIWRELNKLDFPSIYLEYLLINNILRKQPMGDAHLSENFFHILRELSSVENNPLKSTVIDPANSNNILSDLLTEMDERRIFASACASIAHKNWNNIVW